MTPEQFNELRIGVQDACNHIINNHLMKAVNADTIEELLTELGEATDELDRIGQSIYTMVKFEQVSAMIVGAIKTAVADQAKLSDTDFDQITNLLKEN